MNDSELLTFLQVIKNNQGTIGITHSELLSILNNKHNIPPDITKAYIEECSNNGLLKVRPYGDNRYLLQPQAAIWLRDTEFRINANNYIKVVASRFNKHAKTEKSSFRKTVEFWSWVLGGIVALIGIFEFLNKFLCFYR